MQINAVSNQYNFGAKFSDKVRIQMIESLTQHFLYTRMSESTEKLLKKRLDKIQKIFPDGIIDEIYDGHTVLGSGLNDCESIIEPVYSLVLKRKGYADRPLLYKTRIGETINPYSPKQVLEILRKLMLLEKYEKKVSKTAEHVKLREKLSKIFSDK